MQIFIDILRFTALSQIILLLLFLSKKENKSSQVWVTIFFGCCAIAYLLAYWSPIFENRPLFLALLPFSVALPLSFWLFSKSLFDDSFKWQPTYTYWTIGIILLHYSLYFLNGIVWGNLTEDWQTIAKLPPYILSLFFVLMGILEAIRNYEADLVIPRLQFRYPFIMITSIIMLLTTASLMALQHDNLPQLIELIQKILITFSVFYFVINQLALKSNFFEETKTIKLGSSLKAIDEQVLSKLNKEIDKKIYLKEGLTIRQLAEELHTKEYKLRQLINQQLGFKNFNEFINNYRIKDACTILSNPNKKELTIMEIAYETGYTSLTPFNKAFKKITGLTPTAYRKEHLP